MPEPGDRHDLPADVGASRVSRKAIYFETSIDTYPDSPLRLFAERRLQSLRAN